MPQGIVCGGMGLASPFASALSYASSRALVLLDGCVPQHRGFRVRNGDESVRSPFVSLPVAWRA